MNEYQPFDDEWGKYMKSLKKDFLIAMIKEQSKKILRIDEIANQRTELDSEAMSKLAEIREILKDV